jgi:hypothetical protein
MLLLRVSRKSDSEEQGQNGCAGDLDYFHGCCLHCTRLLTASFLSLRSPGYQ